ncbi:C6 transcription factor [Colletotrichum truncatum]|uniref:C6 transcription factor n=1 Tax=Colletotrichum truncatum TaxID=5467 RepID=A0ACC3YGN5_COLTU|nr:C6 transcription factor [Colletotrichum truncatum]KAF6781891.1 C6 transcription factor [Colletotrichum truncatum]
MAPPKNRVRKFHRRSKNGCSTCKQRHVRCDERKPLCTTCLQTGRDCVYPDPVTDVESRPESEPDTALIPAEESARLVNVLSHQPFDGFSGDYQLSEMSQWLFHQFSNFYVRGQTPVERGQNLCSLQRTFMHPGLLHGCLVVAACQWAWVTGSLEQVKVPFLYHKAAAYEFAKKQLSESENGVTDTAVFAIASLALTEGAVGDLDASSKHLRGLHKLTLKKNGYNLMRSNLAQQMLEMAGDRLRRGEVHVIHDAISADFQPSIIALLFTSLWDMESLPPRQAPRYGWWEGAETPTDLLWQGYTKNLNWELSRGFDPERNIATMLNGDPKSSRASYIATFFYLVMAVNDSEMDCVLTVWLLEQLIDDVCNKEEEMISGSFSRSLWFWSVLFGAAVANSGRPITATGKQQLAKWRAVYSAKLCIASSVMQLDDWRAAKVALAEVAWTEGTGAENRLREIWENAMSGRGVRDDGLDVRGHVIV